ncbi:hypothetical protein AB0B25_24040 [Nocardia sp. NPDC049190]|uniref:hypothetical protein n=1 Tax=Nocardia sp. NPDC049190 TaxID=3155650 RepID=UPI0033EA718A
MAAGASASAVARIAVVDTASRVCRSSVGCVAARNCSRGAGGSPADLLCLLARPVRHAHFRVTLLIADRLLEWICTADEWSTPRVDRMYPAGASSWQHGE